MSNFLYYFPGVPEMGEISLEEHGLQYAFESGRPPIRNYFRSGPDGGRPGPILCIDPPAVGDDVEWNQSKAGYWIGWHRDKPPTEKELRRKKRLPGREIELREGSGESWLIPMEREFEQIDGLTLPRNLLSRVLVWDEDSDGFRIGPVESKYQALADIASRWIDHVMAASVEDESDKPDPLTIDDAARMAVSALQYNYRIGFREASILKLLSEDKYSEILNAVIDMHGYLELLKKTSRGGESNSKNGEAVATEDTRQPLPTG